MKLLIRSHILADSRIQMIFFHILRSFDKSIKLITVWHQVIFKLFLDYFS